jgi:DNA-binding NtrC family response regulator
LGIFERINLSRMVPNTMHNSGSILIYGRDAALLETRRLLLESAGFTVATALELAAITQLLSGPAFDLSLLCHTLSHDERETLMSVAQRVRPEMKFIVMSAPGVAQGDSGRHSVVDVFDGPEKLVNKVKSMVGVASSGMESGS